MLYIVIVIVCAVRSYNASMLHIHNSL